MNDAGPQPLTAMGRPIDFTAWIGKPVTDLVAFLFGDVIEKNFNGEYEKHKDDRVKLSDPWDYPRRILNFWDSYSPVRDSDRVIDSSGKSDDQLYQEWTGFRLSGSALTGFRPGSFWDWIPCVWLAEAMKPLVAALDDGLLGVAGQLEPVRSPAQPAVAVPYYALDNRLWCLRREKCRFEVLGADGVVRAVYRRARLIAVVPASPRAGAPSQAAETPVTEPDEAARREDAKEKIRNGWPLARTGSQKIATEFSSKYPEYGYTVEDLVKLADECRGRKLPPGRPPGTTKNQ